MIPSTPAGMDPILFDRGFIDHEHIPRVGPFLDRVLQAPKVAPPERVELQPNPRQLSLCAQLLNAPICDEDLH
jgi:hypothetical protein